MNTYPVAILAIITSMLNPQALAAPGEYWEINSKMEIPGMPFAMPATTSKVCLAKGGENDPRNTSGDKDCQVTDVKTIGNKVSWKARCVHDGEVMTGKGEQTTTAKGYTGKMQLSGKSGGEDVSMNMAFSGQRIGGTCDSEEMLKKAKAQMCDTSKLENTAHWIGSADHILVNCAEQRNRLCEAVRKDAPKDAQTYTLLLQHDQQPNTVSIARECKLDMASTTRSVCKGVSSNNHHLLSTHCPSEVKAFREAQRRKECEGRSYSGLINAETIRTCMSGKNDAEENGNMPDEAGIPGPNNSSASTSSTRSAAGTPESSPASSPVDGVMEGVKKLKGLFGF